MEGTTETKLGIRVAYGVRMMPECQIHAQRVHAQRKHMIPHATTKYDMAYRA